MSDSLLGCFLLTRQWRDTARGLELVYWCTSERGAVRIVVTGEEAVSFVERDASLGKALNGLSHRRRALELRSLSGRPVDGLYFQAQRDLVEARHRLRAVGAPVYESDIKPSDRYLMERFVTAGMEARGEVRDRGAYLELRNPAVRAGACRPALRAAAVDIETEGLDGRLYSIGVAAPGDERVFMIGPETPGPGGVPVTWCEDERSLLAGFFAWLERCDPDLILGWNVVNFDLDFLARRCAALGVPFAMGRGGERAAVLQPRSAAGVRVARLPGRVALDGIEVLRAAFWSFESFELEQVAGDLLGRGKQIHAEANRVEEINRLFVADKHALAAYNIEDCRLVAEIFEQAGLVAFAARRAELTGLALDRLGGSVAAFDNLYLPRLHRRGRVAPDVGGAPGPGSPGGHVMDSVPGLYRNVLVLDFKSLYPSIIRTFRIDPFGLAEPGDDPVPGYEGAWFARDGAILPDLIDELWTARDEAKAQSDPALSQATKILMNSFYGVLGASGCRFHDSRLASSITRRGHDIIKDSRAFIEAAGHAVIYGDTDSLFVHLGAKHGEGAALALGRALAERMNAWWRERIAREWRLESHLELELELLFLRFLMPTVRGERTGSKKRYAGLVRAGDGTTEVVFKGLESVRTDWTPLARRFQRELYRRIFADEPFADYVCETLADLRAGKLDDELVYRKRLRRRLEDYAGSAPPHVQAARMMERPSRWVRYVVTRDGPRPVEAQRPFPPPDHEHYRERQLAPAADGILQFLETSFSALTDTQLAMF